MPTETITIRKQAPCIADVDVLVAGGGISGCTAAVTAARNGARVMVVDRFGSLGGNMGPAMFSGGVLHLATGYPHAMPDGLQGIPGEFISRCEGYADGQLGHNKLRDSQVVSSVWARMMRENSVAVLLNAFIADPIMEANRVAGLVVEHSAGARAIRARVVIDCTGEADVAARAGVPTVQAGGSAGLFFAVAGVGFRRYREFLEAEPEPSAEDLAWAEAAFKAAGLSFVKRLNPLLRRYRRAWEMGEYSIARSLGGGARATLDHGLAPFTPAPATAAESGGILEGQIGVYGAVLTDDDPLRISQIETGARAYIFDTAQFLRRHVPGFETAWLAAVSPFFHSRYGRRCAVEIGLTQEDISAGKRFDDVVFRTYRSHEPPGSAQTDTGVDFPYRQLLPQGVEGLLGAGRSVLLGSGMRTRWKVMLMGQAAGAAAAIAARRGLDPRRIDVLELQRLLLHKHRAPLGEPERLAQLGII